MKLVIPVFKTEFYVVSYELFRHLRTNKLENPPRNGITLDPELKIKKVEQC